MVQTKLITRCPSATGYPLLIKEIFKQILKYEPEREIVYRDLFRYTYRGLDERVRKLANVLGEHGVKAGDTVAVFDWDSHRYLECFFAIPMIGAILHTVNVRLSPTQILYTINHAEDKYILIHEDFLPILDAIQDKIEGVEKYILISDKVYEESANHQIPASKVSFAGEYESLVSAASPAYEFPDFDEDSCATTFYTTGTTGNPKGVYFSHRQLFLHTLSILMFSSSFETQGRFRSNDVYMPITPMFHVHAWGVPYAASLMGVKQVYPGRYEPAMLLGLLVKEKVTFSHCVPTILQMLVNSPAAQQVDLSKWKVIIGGSALNKSLAKAALDLGIDVYSGYGMSETCPLMALTYLPESVLNLPTDEQVEYRTRAGKIAPFVDVRIVDEAGNFLPHDGKAVGEIVARGPWMTQGYFKESEKSEVLWKGGWLHTGDIASITPDAYIIIADRSKDVIKTGGEWVSSIALENLISHVPGVAEAAVVGLPDDKWGERPYAVVVLKGGYEDQVTAETIREYLMPWVEKGDITKWYLPEKVLFVDEIPKTSVGKLDKKRIRTEWSDRLVQEGT